MSARQEITTTIPTISLRARHGVNTPLFPKTALISTAKEVRHVCISRR